MTEPNREAGRPAANAELAVERLSDDETLRNGLEDDAFGPLLEFASYLAIARSNSFPTTDALYVALRSLVKAAVRAANRQGTDDLIAAIAPFAAPTGSEGVARKLARLNSDATENARLIVDTLEAITGVNIEH